MSAPLIIGYAAISLLLLISSLSSFYYAARVFPWIRQDYRQGGKNWAIANALFCLFLVTLGLLILLLTAMFTFNFLVQLSAGAPYAGLTQFE